MMNQLKPQRCIQTRRTPKGHNIQMDPTSWAELMVGLGIAIDFANEEWADKLRVLRTALSQVKA